MMKNITYLITALSFIFNYTALHAGTFTCHTSGLWSGGAAVWTIVSDADGIPDADDDIIIPSGRIVKISAGTQICRNLTINVGGQLDGHGNYSAILKINGNYVNNGAENPNQKATVQFRGAGTTIGGSGTFARFFNWQIVSTRTLLAGSTVVKDKWLRIHNGSNFTNQGTLTCNAQVISYSALSTFRNEGTLTIGAQDFMLAGTFDASAVGNTVIIDWNAAYVSNLIPDAPIFHHLTLNTLVSEGAEFQINTQINGDFTTSLGLVELSTFDITVSGDLSIGAGLQNGNSFTLNGTGVQNFSATGGSFVAFDCPFTIDATSTTNCSTSLVFRDDVVIDGSLTMSVGEDLDFLTDLTINGSLTNDNNTLTFRGTSAQAVAAVGTTALFDVTIDNTAGVNLNSGNFTQANTLSVNNGAFTVAPAVTYTLLSDASGTADIAAICGTCDVAGTINIQRFIPAGNADYRDLTSPFASGPTLAEWDDEIAISCPTCPDGCAYGGGCFVSISTFDDVAGTYTPISGVGDNIDNLRGYEVFMGDDLTSFSGTTLGFRGTINDPANLSYTVAQNGYSFIGNPYASTIDLDILSYGSNVGRFAYIYDASTGNYEYYDVNTLTSTGAVSAAGLVTSSQGFWMFGGNSGAFARTVTITQNDKVATNTAFVKASQKPLVAPKEFRLMVKNVSNSLISESSIWHHEFANIEKDTFDIPVLRGNRPRLNARPGPQIFFSTSDEDYLRRFAFDATNKIIEIIPVIFNSELAGTFEISAKHLDSYNDFNCVLLRDKQTGQIIDLRKNDFTFTHAGSQKDIKNRFELILSNEAMCDIFETVANEIGLDGGFTLTSMNIGNQLKVSINDVAIGSDQIFTLNIFNSLGQMVYSDRSSSTEFSLDNSSFAPGAYIIVVNSNNYSKTDKVIINN